MLSITVGLWLLHAAFLAVLRRLLRGQRPYLRSVLNRTRNPTRLELFLIALAIALPTAPIGSDAESVIARVLILGTICLLGWIALTALVFGASLYLQRFRHLNVEDNLVARKHLTQVRVLLRVLDVVIVLITLGFALMTFELGASIRRQPVCFSGRCRRGVWSCRATSAQQPDRRRAACVDATRSASKTP